MVWLRRGKGARYETPGVIVRKEFSGTYKVNVKNLYNRKVNQYHLRPRQASELSQPLLDYDIPVKTERLDTQEKVNVPLDPPIEVNEQPTGFTQDQPHMPTASQNPLVNQPILRRNPDRAAKHRVNPRYL